MPRIPLPTAVLTALMCLGSIGSAQTTTKPTAPIAAIQLAEAPLMVHGIGLTMLIPDDSSSSTIRIGDNPNTVVADNNGQWRIGITAKRTSDTELTLRGVGDSIVKDLMTVGGKFKGNINKDGVIEGRFAKSDVRLIERIDNLSINEMAAERFYLSFPGGQAQPRLVRGYTIFQIALDRYCILELQTMEPQFALARGVYETVVGTAIFSDPAKLAEGRGLAITAGMALFKQFTQEDYENAIAAINFDGDGRWERLFSPAPSGADADARELGYREIRAWRGFRGELDEKKTRARWKGPDHEKGYLLTIRSRVLIDGQIIDSAGRYFMREDRQTEAWTLDFTVRDPKDPKAKPRSYNELGVRDGKSMSVTTSGTARQGKTYKPIFVEEGYITQVERYLLSPLLMQAKVPNDFAFYYWNSGGIPPSVTLLRASLESPESATGVWTVETRATELQEPSRTFLREDATLLRQNLPRDPRVGEQVWKPITLKQLHRIWNDKGLPMGD